MIEGVEPLVEGGAFPAKSVATEPFRVAADVFAHGHELVRAWLRWRSNRQRQWQRLAMRPVGNDRFEQMLTLDGFGPFDLEIVGEVDDLGTWRRDARRRVEAGRHDPLDGARGSRLLSTAITGLNSRDAGVLATIVAALATASDARHLADQLDALDEHDEMLALLPPIGRDSASFRFGVAGVRERAACSAWYECFPRSMAADRRTAGTLKDVEARLDYVARLGFDVCYLPPIHPIGISHRKGPGNNETSRPGDVGSPWAIGSAAGGHTSIAPELGDLEDFDDLVSAAARRGIEIALDLALQCSPDHPWVREHPEWFLHREDGTIACAENPPKRYQDVYPLDFASTDRAALFQACLSIVTFWMEHGVRIFRVDNPHTKPFALWQWLIAEAKRIDPGVIFLAEAFTRPKVMHRLAKIGFDQSYTYFTWRNTKAELTDYLLELAHGPGRLYFAPNLWPNTPDILAHSLQHGGRPAFVARLLLAACGSANYGIYGPSFELLVDEPEEAGSEEYRHSEKYEVRHFDLEDERSIAPVISRVNEARRAHPALRRNSSLHFHAVDDSRIICWSKRDAAHDDTVLCVVNLDPSEGHGSLVHLDLDQLGIGYDEPFQLNDLLEGRRYTWAGRDNYVLLEPGRDNAHLFALSRPVRRGRAT